MSSKTKTELEHEIQILRDMLEEANEKLEKAEFKAQLDESAAQTYEAYRSLVDAGFTEDQAWAMFLKMVR